MNRDALAAYLEQRLPIEEALYRVEARLNGHRPFRRTAPESAGEIAVWQTSSGSASKPRQTALTFAHLEEEAETLALQIWAHELEGFDWSLVYGNEFGIKYLLQLAKLGIGVDAWLYFNDTTHPDLIDVFGALNRYHLGAPVMAAYSEAALAKLVARPNQVVNIVPTRLVTPLLDASSVRSVIRTGGDAVRPAASPRLVKYYALTETGIVALGCPRDPESYHVLSDRFELWPTRLRAISEHARQPYDGDTGDRFDMHDDACECRLWDIGFRLQIRNIHRDA